MHASDMRRLRGGRPCSGALVVVSVILTVAGSAVALAGPAAAQQGWRPETIPTHGRPSGTLLGIACADQSSCVAVGRTVDSAANYRPLLQTWDGSTWTDVSAAVPHGALGGELTSVSCTSAGACTAVGSSLASSGSSMPLAETTDGPGDPWTVEAAALPSGATGGVLSAVACAGVTCVATGSFEGSSAGAQALGETSSGSGFEVTTVPVPAKTASSQLDAVSCASATGCVAVGSSTAPASGSAGSGETLPLVESWDGTTWTITHTPAPPGGSAPDDVLTGVSCASGSACLAVGYRTGDDERELPLAEFYDGDTWSLDPPKSPAGDTDSELEAVTCTTGTGGGAGSGGAAPTCSAVGAAERGAGKTATLAESWDGSAWTIEATPSEAVRTSELDGVACGEGKCFAVGSETTTDAASTTLAEVRTSTTWAAQPSPDPRGDPLNALASVSCLSGTACTAVGQGRTSAGGDLPLVEVHGGGGGWHVVATPHPGDVTTGGLTAVACASATACEAVGEVVTGAGASGTSTAPLAESYNGSAWALDTVPLPTGAGDAALASLSCPAADTCIAVGYYDTAAGKAKGLAEYLSDGSWTVEATPAESGVTRQLDGVSCTAADSCTAVGSQTGSNGIAVPVAESWDGSTWALEPAPPAPSGSTAAGLTGVDCVTEAACTAVGQYQTYPGGKDPVIEDVGLAERWDGRAWTTVKVESPPAATAAGLSAVSCSGSTCTAVGGYTDGAGTQEPLAESSTGSSFTTEVIGPPAKALGGALAGISCTGAGTCTAVGLATGSSDTSSQALAETE